MNFKNSKLLQIAAAGIFALATVGSADAVATLRISTNGTDWTAAGIGSTFTDTDGDGILHAVFSSGIWSITVAVGDTKPAEGSAASPEMHLNVFALSTDLSGNGGSLYIQFSDDFFG